jgi:ABC-type antimicrobial peptide transport system ATPase subunit
MSAVREDVASGLIENTWQQLTALELLHKEVQHNHERVLRSLDVAATSNDRRDLQIAWNQYRSVVADLSKITEDIESLRLSMG